MFAADFKRKSFRYQPITQSKQERIFFLLQQQELHSQHELKKEKKSRGRFHSVVRRSRNADVNGANKQTNKGTEYKMEQTNEQTNERNKKWSKKKKPFFPCAT